MRVKKNPILDINNRLTNLEVELRIIKQQLKTQSKLIWFILGLIASMFIKMLFF